MDALAGGGNAILLLLTILGLFCAAVAAFVVARRRNEHMFRVLLGVGTTAGIGYLALLLAASLASGEKTLPPGEIKWFCGFYLDCHLGVSVERTETAESISTPSGPFLPHGIFHVVTLRLHNSARNPNLDMTLYRPDATLRDSAGNTYVRVHAAEAALAGNREAPILARETRVSHQPQLATIVFDLPATASSPRLYVREGWFLDRAIELVLINDENSLFHPKTLLALETSYSRKNTNQRPRTSPQRAFAER